MDVKEYLLSLMAIVTGLAIADMIVSLHGLLGRFRKVHWGWLPVVADPPKNNSFPRAWRVSSLNADCRGLLHAVLCMVARSMNVRRRLEANDCLPPRLCENSRPSTFSAQQESANPRFWALWRMQDRPKGNFAAN